MFYGEILFWSLMGVKGFKKLRVVEVICNPAAGGWNQLCPQQTNVEKQRSVLISWASLSEIPME